MSVSDDSISSGSVPELLPESAFILLFGLLALVGVVVTLEVQVGVLSLSSEL